MIQASGNEVADMVELKIHKKISNTVISTETNVTGQVTLHGIHAHLMSLIHAHYFNKTKIWRLYIQKNLKINGACITAGPAPTTLLTSNKVKFQDLNFMQLLLAFLSYKKYGTSFIHIVSNFEAFMPWKNKASYKCLPSSWMRLDEVEIFNTLVIRDYQIDNAYFEKNRGGELAGIIGYRLSLPIHVTYPIGVSLLTSSYLTTCLPMPMRGDKRRSPSSAQ